MQTVAEVGSKVRQAALGGAKLSDRFFQQEEFAYARMSATLPEGIDFLDILRPEYWANVAYKLKADNMTGRRDLSGTIISVRTADHAFYAELYVRAVSDRGLVVGVLKEPVYFGPKEIKSNQYKSRWNPGKKGWEIQRVSDNEIVAGPFPIKEAVQDWIDKVVT